MPSSLTTLMSLVVGGIVFVVLFVILSVTLWVSIVAGVVAAGGSILAGAGTQAGRRGSHAHPHGA
jgi:uncharacterized protein YqfA (UPF0365 family)